MEAIKDARADTRPDPNDSDNRIRLQPQRVPRSNASEIITKPSTTRLPDGMGYTLTTLFKQTADRYHRQELPQGTVEMYLEDWEKLGLKFGLKTFQEGLLRAIESSQFFPDPQEIKAHCDSIARFIREREQARLVCKEMVAWREQWERERVENMALSRSLRHIYASTK
jgi:hypothetical protein